MPQPNVSPAVLDAARFQIRQALNQRYLLVKRIEREGLRRSVLGCLAFVGYRFLRTRFVGSGTGGANQ